MLPRSSRATSSGASLIQAGAGVASPPQGAPALACQWSWWMWRPRGSSPPWRPSSLLPAELRCVAMETTWQTRRQAEAANSSSGACRSEGGGDGVSKHARLCVCPCVRSVSALCVEGHGCITLGVSASMHARACVCLEASMSAWTCSERHAWQGHRVCAGVCMPGCDAWQRAHLG